jgi:hypothetical protein
MTNRQALPAHVRPDQRGIDVQHLARGDLRRDAGSHDTLENLPKSLTDEATARDFFVDAFAHCKFIAHTAAARPLLEKAGIAERDKGVIELHEPGDAASFVEACRGLRLWEREAKVKRI